MRLIYAGPSGPDITLPLPEGWVAADHEEPDEEVAAVKLASGLYREGEPRSKRAKSVTQEDSDASD